MNNQEILITVLIVVLVIFKFFKITEGFDSNNYPCATYPSNSNCSCPTDVPSQRVLGNFPMNYGVNSPYTYSCVSNSVQEPNTNVYPNPPQ
jgi:hypothetical protein